jgi:hypothetical protein
LTITSGRPTAHQPSQCAGRNRSKDFGRQGAVGVKRLPSRSELAGHVRPGPRATGRRHGAAHRWQRQRVQALTSRELCSA